MNKIIADWLWGVKGSVLDGIATRYGVPGFLSTDSERDKAARFLREWASALDGTAEAEKN